MKTLLIIVALHFTPAGNMAPTVQAIETGNERMCLMMHDATLKVGKKDGFTVFTGCVDAKSLPDYLK